MNKYTQNYTQIHAKPKKDRAWLGVIFFFALMIFTGYGAYPEHQIVPQKTFLVETVEAKTEVVVQQKPAEVEKVPAPKPYKAIKARITGYNTVEAQTDQTPCISATGDNICGRNDVVACPRNIKLGTKVEIGGKMYVCLDRTADKFNGRFDISCDKDMACPFKVTGTKEVRVYE